MIFSIHSKTQSIWALCRLYSSCILFPTGCISLSATDITAVVQDSQGNNIPYASVDIRTVAGTFIETVESDERAAFSFSMPSYQYFFLVPQADGFVTSSFTGFSGEGNYTVPNGTIWLRTEEERQQDNEWFGTCATATNHIDGIALLDIPEQPIASLPTITTASVTAVDKEETEHNGCYAPTIDAQTGEQVSSEFTGDSGRFGIFDLEEGVYTVAITVHIDVDEYVYPYLVFVPENGTVPMYPTLIPFLE